MSIARLRPSLEALEKPMHMNAYAVDGLHSIGIAADAERSQPCRTRRGATSEGGAVEPACHSISVVIPAYNAERTIGKVLEALRSEAAATGRDHRRRRRLRRRHGRRRAAPRCARGAGTGRQGLRRSSAQ